MHELANPIFKKKNKKNIINLSVAEFAYSLISVNSQESSCHSHDVWSYRINSCFLQTVLFHQGVSKNDYLLMTTF